MHQKRNHGACAKSNMFLNWDQAVQAEGLYLGIGWIDLSSEHRSGETMQLKLFTLPIKSPVEAEDAASANNSL